MISRRDEVCSILPDATPCALCLPKTPSGPIRGNFEQFPIIMISRDLGDLLGAETVSARRQMEIRWIRDWLNATPDEISMSAFFKTYPP